LSFVLRHLLFFRSFVIRHWSFLLLACALCGCSTPSETVGPRHFDFQEDTLAFANELTWEYQYDEEGKWTTRWREPKPQYAQHCFVLARSARQFFLNARFDPQQPVADEATYERLIRRVVSSTPRHSLPEPRKIVIPGYSRLRDFSQAQEKLLKAECGGAWQSYFQFGHWRMIFPFSRREQERMAKQILMELRKNQAVVVHLVRFPQLTINHAVILFDAQESSDAIQFITYDPNQPQQPITITYERGARTFFLPANLYFPGGRVDVYEVYHRWNY